MARVHYWQYILDEDGRPLENVEIRFYLNDNPTQEADIFTDPALGISTTTSEAEIETNGDGFFEFWVGDEFEEISGYSATQKFFLTWSRAGIYSGSINNIDVFPPIFTVDEEDNTSVTKDDKNKLISNELGFKWESHVDAGIGGAPHSFEPVDTSDGNTTKNKLVSNSLISFLLTALASAGTLSIEASAAVERQFTVTSWSPSGDGFYTNIDHFIGNQYPIVQLRDTDTEKQFIASRIVSVNSNTIRVFIAEEVNSNITVVG